MKPQIKQAYDFYIKEEQTLKKNYPGINWKHFKIELELYFLNLNYSFQANREDSAQLREFLEMTTKGIPLEYINNRAYFYKSEFLVNKDVLIPRNETELLVELAVRELNRMPEESLRILDVGTGSGCIPLSIGLDCPKKLEIIASDLSEAALEVAKINCFRQRFQIPKETTIKLIQADRLKGIEGDFNLITSNPPYIKEDLDRSLVHDQVDKFEPHMALYLSPSEYENWFSEFFHMIYASLRDSGIFIMEGHENHLSDLVNLAENSGLTDIKILPDLSGAHRFLHCIKLQK